MDKKNSIFLGIIFGLIAPCLFLGLVYSLNLVISRWMQNVPMLSLHDMMFVSVALNVIPVRYCFIKEGLEKTGKGMLIPTVVLILIVMFIR